MCVCVCTSQSGVDPVVLPPQPQDLLLSGLDLVHAGSGCLFEVSATLLAAEERPDVPPHHLEHRRHLGLQAFGTHIQFRDRKSNTLVVDNSLVCVRVYRCYPARWAWHHVGRSEHGTESRGSMGNREAPPCCLGNQPSEAPPPERHPRSGQETGRQLMLLTACVIVSVCVSHSHLVVHQVQDCLVRDPLQRQADQPIRESLHQLDNRAPTWIQLHG